MDQFQSHGAFGKVLLCSGQHLKSQISFCPYEGYPHILVDASEIRRSPPVIYMKPYETMRYSPYQLVSRISEPSTVSLSSQKTQPPKTPLEPHHFGSLSPTFPQTPHRFGHPGGLDRSWPALLLLLLRPIEEGDPNLRSGRSFQENLQHTPRITHPKQSPLISQLWKESNFIACW